MRNPVFVIAEAGVNHNGSVDMAADLVRAAAASGADAVKFQTFRAENIVTRSAQKAGYQQRTTGSNESQFSMLEKLELSQHAHHRLVEHCEEEGIQFLSTAFDLESLYFLTNSLRLPLLKIPSGEVTNGPLLLAYAQTGCNLIVSTGMANLEEVKNALSVLAFGMTSKGAPTKNSLKAAYSSNVGRSLLQQRITLLQCTTEYPTLPVDVNLGAMKTMFEEFGVSVGFSDHTRGITAAISAVALGGTVIEKHLTLNRDLPGPDHEASLEPDEFTLMVRAIRDVGEMLGDGVKRPRSCELPNRVAARKSVVADLAIEKGEKFGRANLAIKRPGTGRSPMDYWELLGKRSQKSYAKDEEIE